METIYTLQDDKLVVTEQVSKEYDVNTLIVERDQMVAQIDEIVASFNARIAEKQALIDKANELA